MKTLTSFRAVIRMLAILSATLLLSLLTSCTVTVWDSNGVGTTYMGDGSYIKQWPSGYMKQYFPGGRTKVLHGGKSKSASSRKPRPKSSSQPTPGSPGAANPATGGSPSGSEEIYVPKTGAND